MHMKLPAVNVNESKEHWSLKLNEEIIMQIYTIDEIKAMVCMGSLEDMLCGKRRKGSRALRIKDALIFRVLKFKQI